MLNYITESESSCSSCVDVSKNVFKRKRMRDNFQLQEEAVISSVCFQEKNEFLWVQDSKHKGNGIEALRQFSQVSRSDLINTYGISSICREILGA